MKEIQPMVQVKNVYKIIIVLLIANNVSGITLNFELFKVSLQYLIGIPGLLALIYYLIEAPRKNPLMYVLVHLSALAYNGFLYFLISNENTSIIGGAFWPLINSLLSFLLLALSFTTYVRYTQ